MSVLKPAAVLGALALGLIASGARAEDQRIHVGDLSDPAQVAQFDRDLGRATTQLCGARWDHRFDRSGYSACVAAVHDEAMGLLTPIQRQQYAAGEAIRLADAGRGDHARQGRD
jgi:UrcA family protein